LAFKELNLSWPLYLVLSRLDVQNNSITVPFTSHSSAFTAAS